MCRLSTTGTSQPTLPTCDALPEPDAAQRRSANLPTFTLDFNPTRQMPVPVCTYCCCGGYPAPILTRERRRVHAGLGEAAAAFVSTDLHCRRRGRVSARPTRPRVPVPPQGDAPGVPSGRVSVRAAHTAPARTTRGTAREPAAAPTPAEGDSLGPNRIGGAVAAAQLAAAWVVAGPCGRRRRSPTRPCR